jgi:hypothetical protein
LKKEIEETSEKYDKMIIKFRDANADKEKIKNIHDVLTAQKENSDEEL